MLAAVMVVEGLLRAEDGEAHRDVGWSLYQALAKNTRLYLLSATWTEEQCALWLAKRQLRGHIGYLHQTIPGTAGRLEALDRIRSWHIGLVLEPDPSIAAALLRAGWSTAVITHSTYTQPQWRPDYDATPRPWDDLTDAVEQQTALRLTDPRTQEQP